MTRTAYRHDPYAYMQMGEDILVPGESRVIEDSMVPPVEPAPPVWVSFFTSEVPAFMPAPVPAVVANDARGEQPPHPKGYRTEMCKHNMDGPCKYGADCIFAHHPRLLWAFERGLTGRPVLSDGLLQFEEYAARGIYWLNPHEQPGDARYVFDTVGCALCAEQLRYKEGILHVLDNNIRKLEREIECEARRAAESAPNARPRYGGASARRLGAMRRVCQCLHEHRDWLAQQSQANSARLPPLNVGAADTAEPAQRAADAGGMLPAVPSTEHARRDSDALRVAFNESRKLARKIECEKKDEMTRKMKNEQAAQVHYGGASERRLGTMSRAQQPLRVHHDRLAQYSQANPPLTLTLGSGVENTAEPTEHAVALGGMFPAVPSTAHARRDSGALRVAFNESRKLARKIKCDEDLATARTMDNTQTPKSLYSFIERSES